jgi:hypothetical protein
MAAYSTRGVTITLAKGGAAPAALVPTAISKAKPALVTIASTTGILSGDLVHAIKTGFPELDGKAWVVGTVDGTAHTFTLPGSNTTGSTGVLDPAPTMNHHMAADQADLSGILGELTMAREAPTAVEAGTYKDPSQTVPNQVVKAGTFAFKGPLDVADPGYTELYAAYQDGQPRDLVVHLPNNGSIMAPVTVAMVLWENPLDGAQDFSGTMVMGTAPRHLY